MKPSNPNFFTRLDGQLTCRNLAYEESMYRTSIFNSYENKIIDEPIVIYYEVYDCHQSPTPNIPYKDECIYQRNMCFIKKGDIVLDLGANIGIFSRFASDVGASKIYSFEPIIDNFELLMLNRPDNCEPHRIAISNRDNDCISMGYDKSSPGGSSFIHKVGQEQTAMTMTINTLINNGIIEQPNFIKMDIEGAEVMAFEGISDDVLRKTRCISMEMHANILTEEQVYSIYDRLESLGFEQWTLRNPDRCNIVHFTNKNLI